MGDQWYMKHRSCLNLPHEEQSFLQSMHHCINSWCHLTLNWRLFFLRTHWLQVGWSPDQCWVKTHLWGVDCVRPCERLCPNRDRMALSLLLAQTPIVQEDNSKYLMTKTASLQKYNKQHGSVSAEFPHICRHAAEFDQRKYLQQGNFQRDIAHFHGGSNEFGHIWGILIKLEEELLLFKLEKKRQFT